MLQRALILSLLVLPWMAVSAQAGEAYAAEAPQQPYPYVVPQQQPAAQVAVSTPYGYYYQQQQPAPRPAAAPAYPAYNAPAAEAAPKKIDIMQMNSF